MATNTAGQRPKSINTGRLGVWTAATALLLLVPLAAMQFSDDVAWTAFDFAFVAVLLMGAALAFEVAVSMTHNFAYRAGVGLALVTALMLIWITGAVGIIGTEDNGANLMYGAVLAIALLGAVIARFRPAGMARAMFAAAIAQAAVAAIAIIAGAGDEDPLWPLDIIGVTVILVALWCASGWLFLRAPDARS